MKILIVGPQLSGKTTIVRYLRSKTNIPIAEVDEKILEFNSGTWPEDHDYKNMVLIPAIYKEVSVLNSVIFFANYFSPTSLMDLFRSNGFKIYLLTLSKDEIFKRNEYRIENEGYDDASPWIDGQLENHEKLLRLGLIDTTLDATQSTEILADTILELA